MVVDPSEKKVTLMGLKRELVHICFKIRHSGDYYTQGARDLKSMVKTTLYLCRYVLALVLGHVADGK